MKLQHQKFYKNLKKIFRKFIFITDILFYFIISYAMLTEWYYRGMPLFLPPMGFLILGLLLFITVVRKYLKKPPIYWQLFKQHKTTLITFVISLIFFKAWYDYYWFDFSMDSMLRLILGLLFYIISITIGVRKILKKTSFGELFGQFRTRNKS